MLLLIAVSGASGKGVDAELKVSAMPYFDDSAPPTRSMEGARLDTFWIFDADFEDLEGPNANWTSFDRSGTLASDNYWHHDTIRIRSLPHLGDTTWWCGTYNECWRQPRGYANDWVQVLKRNFPEIEANTEVGDPLTLDWDQRFAMENNYDYGYVEISTDGGANWDEIYLANNTGFAGLPGRSWDWDEVPHGHQTHDLSAYAGLAIDIRFRFASDEAYSSQDQYNNAPANSVKDGAWQLDNIKLTGPGGVFWLDDSESGNMGWVHDDVVASGQTGVTFTRGIFDEDFETGRPFTCDDRQGWMMAAVDPFTSTMVLDQFSWLMSPPIDISGAAKLVGHWDFWLDMPRTSNTICNLYLASNDLYQCVTDPAGFVEESVGWWYGDPGWRIRYDDWDAFAGNEWLAILWAEQNDEPPNGPLWAGIILNRQRVGIPSGDAGTSWTTDVWNSFNDWFDYQLTDALLDTARIKIKDDDDIVEAHVMASNDDGLTWSAYPCRREEAQSDWWFAPPPADEMTAGSVIKYYYEAIDGVGSVATLPSDAPDRWFEMSILPIDATLATQGILLVDKHGRTTPGEARYRSGYSQYRPLQRYHAEFYYQEMLAILGYEYEVYDVEVPSGSTDQSNGPDSAGMKYYDTQIWFVNEFNAYTVKPVDQGNLIGWLNASTAYDRERNLLLTGNDIGFELMDAGKETLQFYETWLATRYVADEVGAVTVDSIPGLENHAGGFTFMDHDDGECILRGGCPVLNYFDVIEPYPGLGGTEIVADYIKQDDSRLPAGVAYTHPSYGYQTVNLGFGMEFMMDGTYDGGSANYTPEGYYHTGVADRANFMQNIMDYFDKSATGDPDGVVDGGHRNSLSQAFPNPFNPVTKIAYSIRESGPVTIEVYNVAGKVVRTLLDTELEAGAAGTVVWNGANDAGERCASGVYFYRITAPEFVSSRKMVMLK